LPVWRRAAAAGLVLAVTVAVGSMAGVPAGAATQLTLSPASGPPGTEFVITGTGLAALPVEIRWGGLSGPVIATATGPAFTVTAVVPDSPPNSHPVMAVVTDGASVSTSSASFQVTTGAAPPAEETTTTSSTSTSTSTTIAQPPATTPTVSIPGGETLRDPLQSGTSRGGLGGGVDGGGDGGMADTTNAAGATPAASAGSGAGAGSTVTTLTVASTSIPTITSAPVAAPAPAPTGQEGSAAPLLPGDGVTAAAMAPTRTSQSAGAVSNPGLLFLGLALVFGGGVFLAVRNRHRA